MAAIYWYWALAAVGVVMTVFILHNKKNVYECITFFLFAMMLAFVGEMIVLLFFDSYAYKPGVFTDYYAENIFGHIVPNATLWPATALLVGAYALGYRWIGLITVIFTLLDMLYVNLGVYQHNWWQTWMTSAAIFIYCVLMKSWFARLQSKRRGILRYITFWFSLLVILKLPVTLLLFSGLQYTVAGWFENLYRDSGVFSVFYNAALSFFCTFFLCIWKKWYGKLVPFLIYFSFDALLLTRGMIFFNGGWNLYCLMLVRTACLLIFMALEHKYPYNPPAKLKA